MVAERFSEERAKFHVRLIGFLFIVGSIVGIFFVIGGPHPEGKLGPRDLWSSVYIPGIVIGYSLRRFKNWARIAAMVLATFNLINFPYGTIFSIYVLYMLRESKCGYICKQTIS